VQLLRSILGAHDIGLARRELPHLGLTLIGLCPLQSGGPRRALAGSAISGGRNGTISD
jgi:hypothetical protein